MSLNWNITKIEKKEKKANDKAVRERESARKRSEALVAKLEGEFETPSPFHVYTSKYSGETVRVVGLDDIDLTYEQASEVLRFLREKKLGE